MKDFLNELSRYQIETSSRQKATFVGHDTTSPNCLKRLLTDDKRREGGRLSSANLQNKDVRYLYEKVQPESR